MHTSRVSLLRNASSDEVDVESTRVKRKKKKKKKEKKMIEAPLSSLIRVKPRLSGSEFALSFANHFSREWGCGPRNRDCEYRAVLASSGSYEVAMLCSSRFRKSPQTPSSRFRLRRRKACHWRPSSRWCHLKFEHIFFFLYVIFLLSFVT